MKPQRERSVSGLVDVFTRFKTLLGCGEHISFPSYPDVQCRQ
jgi:hypothetical protein